MSTPTIVYLTSKGFPARTADHIYVRELVKALAKISRASLVVSSNDASLKDELADIPEVYRVFPFQSGRALYYFFWIPFFMFRKPKKSIFISNDGVLLFMLLFWNVFLCKRHHIVSDWHHRFGTFRDRLIARGSHKLICLTKALRDQLVRDYGIPMHRTLISPDAVDLAVFDLPELHKNDARDRYGLPIERPVMVYTGRFTTLGMEKGIGDVIASLREPGMEDFYFAAVGGLEEDLVRYTQHAIEFGVADRVRLVGNSSQAMLAEYQRAADMLVMYFPDAAHYQEFMSPMKLFEYMASGRPLLTSDLHSIREVVDESAAFFVPVNDIGALARTAISIMRELVEAERRAARAYQLVRKYTWDQKAQKILSHLGSL